MPRRRTSAPVELLSGPAPAGENGSALRPPWTEGALDPDGGLATADALLRVSEAEDTLRAIAAGEVDAFVVSDGGVGRRVFTLSTADRPYRKFVENMRDGAATLSEDGIILYANQRLATLLGCNRDTILGSPLAEFVTGGPSIGLGLPGADDSTSAAVELDLVNASGLAVPVLVGVSSLDVGGSRLACLTFTDLSDQKDQEREIARLGHAQAERMLELQSAQAALTKQATHDALTGLPNRSLLVDRIEQCLAHARRSGRCTAVLFVDLDRFKQVNDTRGHAAGDALLELVAQALVRALRPMDTVARIGGDEFVVLAPDLQDHLRAADIGARLVAALCELDRGADGDQVASSVGIAVSVAGRGSAETLLREADTAMYHAKARGGGRAEAFDEALGRQVQQRTAAKRILRLALDDHRIVAHYQPLIDLGSGGVAGFEALARIIEVDGTLLAPSAFMAVAEDSGLVVPLGAQILGLACQEACAWPAGDAASPPPIVAVNLSARQFLSGELTEEVRRVLEQTGLHPGRLHFELTETAIIDLRPDTLKQLEALREQGVQVGLDDFGTGYASLTHLRRLPLTFVKIDQTFVQGLGADGEDERIVAAVIDLAANLGLRSIAEGVETPAQLARLRELGCGQAQGYLFSRPMPPDGVPAALRHAAW